MSNFPESRPLPPVALLLSLVALSIPVVFAFNAPGWMGGEVEVLMWLFALLPAFLLTYYKGWRGASLAISGGMALLALTQVGVLLWGDADPNWRLLGVVVVVFVGVTLGLGYFAELLDRERRKAARESLTDPLTGLPNRRHTEVFLDTAFSAAERGTLLSVVIFDLDDFRSLNDAHGYGAGDAVLKELGQVLGHRTRRMDLSARMGGEEFISILYQCDQAGAETFANRVLGDVRALEFPWGGVTVSAGVAQCEPGMGFPEILLGVADMALREAKKGGGDRVGLVPLREADAGARRESPGRRDAKGARAVVVDDDRAAADSVSRTLKGMGYQVRAFHDPREALTAAGSAGATVDLLVAGILLPGMGGLSLADELARTQPQMKVLYLSEGVSGEVTWLGVPGKRTAYIQKPVSRDELKEKLAELG